ncbi:MAG: hypothetical protein NZ992_05110 [Candidatus Korarchaeum sp.]|nr:hypothetical protein [Candidatus Korarchaeum sp.]MDW8035530.1 hypothetical protein [Candidatus Korarchaeum sp.]
MPRRNPREGESFKGWKGMKGRKGRENLYQVRLEGLNRKPSSLKPGDLIEVLVRSVNRRGEGEGIYEGKQVVIVGAPDPGVAVKVRVRKIAGDKIFTELAEEDYGEG